MAKLALAQLEQTTEIPSGSLHLVEMGDGSGTKVVTQKTMAEETGKALKIGNMEELQTENKTSIVAAINEVQQSGGSGGTSVDILDSQEEIEANTEAGKAAGALAVQEMFGALNDKLNGNILTYNESEDAYYIQYGADAVPKKLGNVHKLQIEVTLSYWDAGKTIRAYLICDGEKIASVASPTYTSRFPDGSTNWKSKVVEVE